MADPKEGTLDWFLETVVIRDLGQMITSGLRYLSFAVMGSAIELLGAIYDSADFHKTGLSEKRFNAAIKTIQSLKGYRPYMKPTHYDLYTNMRCGMAHVGKPGNGVVFTERADPQSGHLHLQTLKFSGNPRLILVCEELYEDIVKAVADVRGDAGNLKKQLTQDFMNPHLSADTPLQP